MGETSGMRARDWRMGAVLLLVLLLAVLLAARPADAQPRIKVAGCNVYAALEVAKRLGKGKRVVTIIPDAAERYMSKGIYSRWRKES